MAGYKLIAVTGIDGDISLFNSRLAPHLPDASIIRYDKTVPYSKNFLNSMEHVSSYAKDDPFVILGWSIGGAIAIQCTMASNCLGCIAINTFSDRRTILAQRNIEIDKKEEASPIHVPLKNKKVLLIAGAKDTKIHCNNSIEIFNTLKNCNNVSLYISSTTKHSIDSLSFNSINTIVNFLNTFTQEVSV